MKRIIFAIILAPIVSNGQIITTVAGNGTQGYSGNGDQAISAEFHTPIFIKLNDSGYFFVSDYGNNVIRKISPSGIVSIFAGNGTSGFSGDNGQANAAQLKNPGGVAFDKHGNTYIADWGNNRIRKVNANGIITTIAGTGSGGYSGDGGPATNAKLYLPINLTFDVLGNLYVADHYNHVVRKIDTTGIITTVAGTGTQGYSGDNGLATMAEFYFPIDIAFDSLENLYIVDAGNDVVRKINTSGIVSTIAGNGTHGYTGDSVAATATGLWAPSSLAIDKTGNIFIADDDNQRIREISTLGIIRTVAGNGIIGFSGDDSLAINAELNYPEGVALDTCGNLYIADEGNNRIRKVTFDSTCGSNSDTTTTVQNIKAGGFSVYPNPASKDLTLTLSINGEGTTVGEGINSIVLYNMVGQVVYNKMFVQQKKITIDISALPNGVYFVKVNGGYVEKVVKE